MAGPTPSQPGSPPGLEPGMRSPKRNSAVSMGSAARASIMNAYDDPDDSEGDMQQSVEGEALGGSRPSTAMRSPFLDRGTPLMANAPMSSGGLRPSPLLQPQSLTHSPAMDSPEVVYAEAFDTDETPTIPAGRWSSPQRTGNIYPSDQRDMAGAVPLEHSTPPRVSPSKPILPSSRASMDSQVDLSNYYVREDEASEPELDLIDSYDQDPSRRVSRMPDAISTTHSILDDYGRAPSASSTISHKSGKLTRVPRTATPETPQTFADMRRKAMRADSDSDHASLTDMYTGLYDTPRSAMGTPTRARYIHNYAPGVGEMSEPDQSVVSFPDQSTDQFILPPDYQSQVFLGDPDQIQGGDRDWDERRPKTKDHFSVRGCANVTTIVLLVLSLLMLFLGYPVLTAVRSMRADDLQTSVLGRTPGEPLRANNMSNLRTDLVDPDTPEDVRNRVRFRDGKPMVLVFSDEFNTPGRSFYPGEDPFWQAEDLHYWQTENYEWYDPETITTEEDPDGTRYLSIKLSEKPEHALNFRGGMLSSWNKFCFTGGYVETRIMLPGRPNVTGLWPAAWTMGNLGRAGYGASTDGLWPYSYDSCDVGTLANQTYLDSQGGGPAAADTMGHYVDQYGPKLSLLPGQRLSRCSCPDADHPGPKHADGTWVGRSAPEIDIIEASANNGPDEFGQVSMSLQVAPFDAAYNISREQGRDVVIYNVSGHETIINDYTGSAFQQAVSAKVNTSKEAYEQTAGKYDLYGFEYGPGGGRDAFVTWTVSGEPVITINSTALGPNNATEVGQRLIPEEPMYIIFNLGIASSFAWINWDALEFPAKMKVDYIRVWQEPDKIQTSCSPPNFPTKEYIERHKDAYYNRDLTTWTEPKSEGGYNHPFPGNMLIGQCR